MRAFILAVTGLAIGVAACGSYGTSTIEVQKTASVAAVAITLPSPSLVAGQKERANVAVRDANGVPLTGRSIVWYSSSASVATVTDSGVISAVAPGTATVSAVSEGVAGQAAMTVIPPTPGSVAKVLVVIAPAAVVVGQIAHATAALQDSAGNPLSGRTVTWQSDHPSVAAVSGNGDISAVAPGAASITAASEGKTASASLTVSAPAPVPVASVSVSPATFTLQIGATVQLSATMRDASNAVLTGRVVSWSSANAGIASVSSSGLVSAVSAGTTQITALSEGQSSSATITVSAPAPAPVATVSVSPASSSPVVGSTVQLSATLRDANGTLLTGRVVTWSSANPSIASVNSASGLVTALAAGPATTITAMSETKTGTATVSVQAPPPPPPPGSSNEPSGMTPINERSFDALNEDPSWYMAGFSIAQDATAPKSPSNVLRATYQAGFAGGSSPGVGEKSFSDQRVLYISYWAKLSSNFWGHVTGVNKQIYVWANGNPIFYFEGLGVGTQALTPQAVIQGTPRDQVLGPNLVPGAVIPRGQWYHIEIVLTGNSAGAVDGAVDWWVDGVHVGSVNSGIQWTTAATTWNIFSLRAIWGGIGDVVPATMYLDTDHLYLSGKN